MVSQAYKDLISAGAWARDDDALKELPEDLGIDRADGYPVAYEQQGTGKHPELEGWNQRFYEIDSGCIDVALTGIPAWDADVDYTPTTDAHCFAVTATGLHVTAVNTGPSFDNTTDPDAESQTVWRRY